jgi:acyl-coenzyme A thioesterase PaaI-like protein
VTTDSARDTATAAGARGDEPADLGMRLHPRCVVCGRENSQGLQLRFTLQKDGSVEGSFDCNTAFEGYPDRLHGGVIALLLDGVMTNCLFAHGREAVTAELKIRFRGPVRTDRPARVRGWIERSAPPLYYLAAQIEQDQEVRAQGTAKFMSTARAKGR